MEEMGMTDKQFNLFLRFLQRALQEAKAEEDTSKKNKKIDELLEDIKKSIED